jgi:WD40 repeat protein
MLAISRDRSRLLCACRVENGYVVRIWSMATGVLMAALPIVRRSASISAIAFSPDGRFAATGTVADETGGDDRRRTGSPPDRRKYAIIVWDLSTGIPVRTHFGQGAEALAFSPDSSRILAAAGHAATLLDWRTGRSIWALRPRQPQASYSALAFSPDGTHVLAATLASEVEVFDIATRTRTRSLFGAKGFIASIAVSPDGARVIAGDWGLSINIWSMPTGALLKRIACDDRVFSVAFSPDGRKILSGGRDVAARLWDADSGQAIHVMPGDASAEINSVAFSPDGTRAVSGHSDGTVKMWRADTGEEVLTLLGGASGDWLALTPEGFLNGTERAAQGLSLADRREARPLGDAYRVLYRPDLVRAKLAGDPRGEVQEAAAKLDLAKFSAGAPRRD